MQLCGSHPVLLNEAVKLGYRSKAARLGAAMGAGLFSSNSEEKAMRLPDDSQACIRSALRRRRRTLGLTQEDAASLLGDLFEEVHVGFVGGEAIHRDRPERRIAGGLEHDRPAAVIEPEPTPTAPHMRAEETCLPPERDELAPQILARTMRALPRIALERKDPVSHKPLGTLLQLDEIVRERKVHQYLRFTRSVVH